MITVRMRVSRVRFVNQQRPPTTPIPQNKHIHIHHQLYPFDSWASACAVKTARRRYTYTCSSALRYALCAASTRRSHHARVRCSSRASARSCSAIRACGAASRWRRRAARGASARGGSPGPSEATRGCAMHRRCCGTQRRRAAVAYSRWKPGGGCDRGLTHAHTPADKQQVRPGAGCF